MSPAARRPLLVAFALLLSAAALTAATGTASRAKSGAKNTVNFERTKTRIASLLGQRLKPTTLPDTLPDPFQLPDAAPLPLVHEREAKRATEPLATGSDSDLLLFYGATLRISGTVRINEQTHLIINQAPYKEGDIFTVKNKDVKTKLRIIGIAPGELTLGLNDAVQVIKFKK
jgi:hypothetical protein